MSDSSLADLALDTVNANRELIATLDDLHAAYHTERDGGFHKATREERAARKVNRAKQMIDNGHKLAQTYALIAIVDALEDIANQLDREPLTAEQIRQLANAGDGTTGIAAPIPLFQGGE